jgi:hypothetical protein
MIAERTLMKAALLILLIVSMCGDAAAQSKEDKRVKQLESEQKKLQKTKNPADRAKSLMKIAEIRLSYANDSTQGGDLPEMRMQLAQYKQVITDARDALIQSGRDAHKESGTYRAVEIALRKQLRILQDMARSLIASEREPVQDVIDVVTKIHDEFMRALFG